MNFSKKKHVQFEIYCSLFIGFFVTLLLIKAFYMEEKYLKAIIAALLVLSGLVVVPMKYLEKITICLLVFFLPLNLNKLIIYEPLNRVQSIEGTGIWGFDLFFFPLFLLWIHRLTIDYTIHISFFPHITIPFFLIFISSVFGLFYVDRSFSMKFAALFEMFKCWLILIYAANNIKDDRTIIYLVVAVLLLTGMFQGYLGIGQYIKKAPLGLKILGEKTSLTGVQAGISRVGGTIGHANKYALFLGTLLQINLACFFVRSTKKYYLFIISTFTPMAIALFLSYSRSGWFAFLIGGAINGSWCMAKRTGKKIVSVLLVFGFFIAFAGIVFIASESVRNRILLDDKGAGEVRKPLAQVALNVIKLNQFLGIGLNNYTSCYPKYDNTSYWVSIEFPEIVHNEFLLIAAELGIPAFLFFCYIMMYLLVTLWRISLFHERYDHILPYIAIGWFSGLISWSIHSLKEYQSLFFTFRFWFNAGIIMAIFSFTSSLEEYYESSTSGKTGGVLDEVNPTAQSPDNLKK